jgi:hypothetical protein
LSAEAKDPHLVVEERIDGANGSRLPSLSNGNQQTLTNNRKPLRWLGIPEIIFRHALAKIPSNTRSMTEHSAHTKGLAPHPFYTFGLWAVLAGGLGLIIVFVHIAYPSLQPAPSVGSQIGEIAGDIGRSAWFSLRGLEDPKPVEEEANYWMYLAIIGPALGVVALVLSLISGLRRENWHYPAYGAGLGVAAITFQFFWLIVALIGGVLLLIAIIENIGDIFS